MKPVMYLAVNSGICMIYRIALIVMITSYVMCTQQYLIHFLSSINNAFIFAFKNVNIYINIGCVTHRILMEAYGGLLLDVLSTTSGSINCKVV